MTNVKMGNRKQETYSRKRETGNRKRETGNNLAAYKRKPKPILNQSVASLGASNSLNGWLGGGSWGRGSWGAGGGSFYV